MVQEPWRRTTKVYNEITRWEETCTAHMPPVITDQWNHAVHQRDVLVLQALHVSHDVRLRMIAGERKETEGVNTRAKLLNCSTRC